MWLSQTRRSPRLAPIALPRLARPDLWRRYLEAVLAMLLLTGLALWAVSAYGSYKATLRQAETSRYLAEFRAPAVAEPWQRLSAAWQAGQDRQDALLAKLAELSGPEFEVALRNYHQFVLETVEEQRLAPQIEAVRQFFVRLGVCIQVGNCAQDVAASHLRLALRQFRDQHYLYFASEGVAAEFDRIVALIMPDEPWSPGGPAPR